MFGDAGGREEQPHHSFHYPKHVDLAQVKA